MTNPLTQVIQQTHRQPSPPPTGHDTANKDKDRTAHIDRPDQYSNFVRALATKFTNSPEEAEAAVQEMYSDIKRCTEKGLVVSTNEERLVAGIAWRRLLKFLQ